MMSLTVHYDAAGCTGTTTRATGWLAWEPFRPLVIAAAMVGLVGTTAGFLEGAIPLVLWALGAMLCIGLAVFSTMASTSYEEAFAVERGVLRITDPEGVEQVAELSGARVLKLPDGLMVNPRLGSPVTLRWGRADAEAAQTLFEMLEAATAHDLQAHGTSHNIPEQIRKITEGG